MKSEICFFTKKHRVSQRFRPVWFRHLDQQSGDPREELSRIQSLDPFSAWVFGGSFMFFSVVFFSENHCIFFWTFRSTWYNKPTAPAQLFFLFSILEGCQLSCLRSLCVCLLQSVRPLFGQKRRFQWSWRYLVLYPLAESRFSSANSVRKHEQVNNIIKSNEFAFPNHISLIFEFFLQPTVFFSGLWIISKVLGMHAATAWSGPQFARSEFRSFSGESRVTVRLGTLAWAILNICNHLPFDTRIHLPLPCPKIKHNGRWVGKKRLSLCLSMLFWSFKEFAVYRICDDTGWYCILHVFSQF